MSDLYTDDLLERYESQYARSADGRLIQIEQATLGDLDKPYAITIDGKQGIVKKAVPATDEQGNIRHNKEGDVVPRLTTIYDAALQLFGEEEVRQRIPILCHQHHQTPVGVCRVCSVLTYRNKRAADRLIPACQHPVNQDGMQVHTRKSEEELAFADGKKRPAGDYVRDTVKVLFELLAINHLHKDQKPGERKYNNELLALAENVYGIEVRRDAQQRITLPGTVFRRPERPRAVDTSSEVIHYDANNCILCDRCVRGCSEVKPFQIIGHTGFGNKARISFDLGKPMADSECVSCGECAVSCPTGALTFERKVYGPKQDPWKGEHLPRRPATVPAEDLTRTASEPINRLFAGVPFAFLKWNEGAVGRLQLSSGEKLCEEDEYGSTAFLIEKGSVEVLQRRKGPEPLFTRTPEAVVLGELACLSHLPRTAALRAAPEGVTVLVIKRNLLYMLQRNKHAREVLFPKYAERALQSSLAKGALFEGLKKDESDWCVALLQQQQREWEKRQDRDETRQPLLFLQVNPEQKIVRQNSRAEHFYIIYRGHVSISDTDPRRQALVRDYLGPGRHFGEIGLLSDPELSPRVAEAVSPGMRGRRTGTVTALDHVELVRIGKDAFRALLARDEIREHLERRALELLGRNIGARETIGQRVDPFTEAGLHQGQKLLVLDLNRCTRCQECVKACAESHGGVTRVLLEGNRVGHYLVPSACRSCYDPACLVGCPVDAIHRRSSAGSGPGVRPLAIVIEDHCIGCGLCAHNCPFGSIHMSHRGTGIGSEWIATNCNLCEDSRLGFEPQCEKRCPHDAAIHLPAIEVAKKVGLNPTGAARENV